MALQIDIDKTKIKLVSWTSDCQARVQLDGEIITFIHISPYQIDKIRKWFTKGKLDKVKIFFNYLLERKQVLCQ